MPRTGWRLLHLTPHLGGGVGRALVGLAEGDKLFPATAPERTVWCLEPPQKPQAVQRLQALGVRVVTRHDAAALREAVLAHDLVQCETWNHPRLFSAWAGLHRTPARMVFWCHVSGLHFPRLPAVLWRQPYPVVLSAACSRAGSLPDSASPSVHVVSSAAGFERWPTGTRRGRGAARLGYLGSLNPSKLHPQFVEWLAAAVPGGWSVEVLGDEVAPGGLAARCRAAGRPGLLSLAGYCDDVATVLSGWDAMPYLLNPFHYGTAEFSLLEAMASGVAPIVLDNPCERDIVTDGSTGWVVGDAAGVARALAECRNSPEACAARGACASEIVRERFTTARQASAFDTVYQSALSLPRLAIDWPALIGRAPWQWFHATLPEPERYPVDNVPEPPSGAAGFAHHEITKGSVHHFSNCFPEDVRLRAWSSALHRLAAQDRR